MPNPELPEGVETFSIILCTRCEQLTQDCSCEGAPPDREVEAIQASDLPAIRSQAVKEERERIIEAIYQEIQDDKRSGLVEYPDRLLTVALDRALATLNPEEGTKSSNNKNESQEES